MIVCRDSATQRADIAAATYGMGWRWCAARPLRDLSYRPVKCGFLFSTNAFAASL